jgi:uncharacterized repeat protein (TIGR01451 family)
LEDVGDLNVSFANAGGVRVYLERVWVDVTLRPNIYMYRWMDFKAVDSQSLSVQGAWVNATVTPSGVEAYYYTPSGRINTPPTEVLNYLGKNAISYKQTDPFGAAMIPLFWEIVNVSTMPGSSILGGYDLTVEYWNATSVLYYHATSLDFASYPELSESSQTSSLSVTLTDLVLDKPDLTVTALTALPTIVYEGDTVTLTATVANTGLTAATGVLVSFTDFFGGALTEISNATITLLGTSSTDVSISWPNVQPGLHSITAKADPSNRIIERSESNNEMSMQVNVLANLPELSIASSDIVIDPQPAYTGAQVFANATIRNTLGRASAIDATVEFYAGSPLSGGQFLGSTEVNVPAGGSNVTSFRWIPSQIGDYSIYVYVNRLQAVKEYDYTNNLASNDITVELSTNELDLVVDDNNVVTITGSVFQWGANIVVKDNGVLILDNVDLFMVQSSENQFLILVQDNGTLILRHAMISSDYGLRLYLFDYASLVATDGSSTDLVVTIIADDRSTMDIASSLVQSDIIVPTGSNAVLNAVNTTFGRDWSSFGGNGVAHLTNVSMPSISPVDGAIVYHYRWIVVTVVDGKDDPLPGAFVNLEYYLNTTVSGVGISGWNGKVMFRALCDRITASSVVYLGSYRLNASFWFSGTVYETEGYTTVSLTPYSAPLIRDFAAAKLTIADAVRRPADIVALDIVFRPASPVSVNAHVLMDASANNTGETAALDVVVRFWLGSVGSGVVIDEVVVSLINPGQVVVATGEWDASIEVGQKLQTRTIAAEFNPGQVIPEISYANGNVSRSIVVYDRRPDIMFPNGIEVTSGGHVIDQAVVGESIVIGAQIKNDGYTSAMDVVVSFDITNSEGMVRYIGTVTTDIAANATVTANLTWVVNTTSFGWFNLTMRTSLLGDTGAGEGNYANNEITMQFLVNVPNPIIVIDLGGVYDYKAGTDIVVSGTVTNEISGDPLIGRSAWISLVSASGNVIGANSTATTTASGSFQSSKYIPLGEEGDYKIRVTVQIGDQTFSKTQDITVSRGFVETPTDWWIYAIIIAIVAAIIIFFSLYLYKYGLGRMVECGECGSLIPEASKRCPKCGVQFEAGTAKCSECAAWIPANSTECPECGAKFVTGPIPEEEDEYMKKMREQYQQFVDGYREQAKEVLGKKFSEAKFSDWWKKQPSYITFEKWLSQEEERRKLGAFACPVCGTLNPRGSKVCHKCGTVFETPQEALKEEAEEEGKPRLRRIVKRPVEKKVLKKAEETTAEEKPPEPPEGEPNQGEEPL